MKAKTGIVCGVAFALSLAVGQAGAAEQSRTTEEAWKTGWPNWHGPYDNGSAVQTGVELLDDLSKVRLLWTSEEKVFPQTWQPDGKGAYHTGFGSPVMAEGRVFFTYYRQRGKPDPYFVQLDRMERAVSGAMTDAEVDDNRILQRAAVDADDVVLCLNAFTGKTLWKRAFSHRGVTHLTGEGGRGSSPHNVPCAGDGRVFVLGSAGVLYGLDAASGQRIWETDVGLANDLLESAKAEYLKNRGTENSGALRALAMRAYLLNPLLADGVVVCPDSMNSRGSTTRGDEACGLAGFDAATGRELWRHPLATRGFVNSFVRWRHAGRSYIVTFAKGGAATCIEVRTGKVLWSLPSMGNLGTPAIEGDFVYGVGDYGKGERPPFFWASCWRLHEEGMAKLWEIPDRALNPKEQTHPVIHQQRVFNAKGVFDLETGKMLTAGPPYGWHGYAPGAIGNLFISDSGVGVQFTRISADGKLTAVPNQREAMAIVAKGDDGGQPAIVNGLIFVRGKTNVVCFDVRKEAVALPAGPAPVERVVPRDSAAIAAAAVAAKTQGEALELGELFHRLDDAGARAVAEVAAKMLAEGDVERQWIGCTLLADLGARGAAGVPGLIPLLKHQDRRVAKMAATAVQRIGPAAEAAIPALMTMIKGDQPWQRLHAARALAGLKEKVAPVTGELLAVHRSVGLSTVYEGEWNGSAVKFLGPGKRGLADSTADATCFWLAWAVYNAGPATAPLAVEHFRQAAAEREARTPRKKGEDPHGWLFAAGRLISYYGTDAKAVLPEVEALAKTIPGTYRNLALFFGQVQRCLNGKPAFGGEPLFKGEKPVDEILAERKAHGGTLPQPPEPESARE